MIYDYDKSWKRGKYKSYITLYYDIAYPALDKYAFKTSLVCPVCPSRHRRPKTATPLRMPDESISSASRQNSSNPSQQEK